MCVVIVLHTAQMCRTVNFSTYIGYPREKTICICFTSSPRRRLRSPGFGRTAYCKPLCVVLRTTIGLGSRRSAARRDETSPGSESQTGREQTSKGKGLDHFFPLPLPARQYWFGVALNPNHTGVGGETLFKRVEQNPLSGIE